MLAHIAAHRSSPPKSSKQSSAAFSFSLPVIERGQSVRPSTKLDCQRSRRPVQSLQSPAKSTPARTPGMDLKSKKVKAILFDLDGTCVNSDHIHFETYRETLLELVPDFNNGIPITREYYDTCMSGRQNPDLVASILPDMPFNTRENLWMTKEERYEEIIMRGVPPINGLLDLLEFCKSKNLASYVVTNAPKGSCKKTMKSIGISDHFGTRVVVAEECERPKPDPAPYLRGLKLAGVSAEETIAFEDSPSGIASATAAGILTIGMRSTQTDDVLRKAGATFTVPDYTAPELLDVLAAWTS